MGALLNRRRYMGAVAEPLENRIVTTFNVADASSATQICHTSLVTNKIDSVEIDGVLMDTISSSYQMSVGDHVIKIRMKDITTITDYMFLNVKRITSAVVPNCVTRIGQQAFNGCSNIENITIPYGVTRIDGSTFNSCAKLTEMVIPDSVTTWSGNFGSCSNLETVTLPLSVTSLPNQCFSNCSKLKRINSNTDGVFYLPNVKSLGVSSFNTCKEAVDITISLEATSFGTHVFNGCDKLKRLNSSTDGVANIPTSISFVSENLFASCTQIEIVNMSTTMTTINGSAFNGCSKLKRINSSTDGVFNIPNGVTSIGNAVFRTTLVEIISIPSTLRTLGYSAFNTCSRLTSITLPEGVTTININTFEACSSMTTAELPSTITSIGNYAFNKCSSMTSFILKATTPPALGNNVFASNNCTIYVPASSVSAYQQNSSWSAFASRIQAIPT